MASAAGADFQNAIAVDGGQGIIGGKDDGAVAVIHVVGDVVAILSAGVAQLRG